MKTKIQYKQCLIAYLLIILLTGCAAPETPTLELTTTQVPPTSSPIPLTATTQREWSYVALGDSIPAGYGVRDDNYVAYFADYLRKDLGVDLEVLNYAQSGHVSGRLLDLLQIDREIRQAVSDANVITIWIGLNDVWAPENRYKNGMCGGEDNLDCIRETVAQINENIEAILDEILALNTSEKTRIMIADNVIPLVYVREWKTQGSFDLLKFEAFESWQNHLAEAASERGIIVVYTCQAINGPLGDQENEELYLYDGVHFTAEGHKLIADLHRETWE